VYIFKLPLIRGKLQRVFIMTTSTVTVSQLCKSIKAADGKLANSSKALREGVRTLWVMFPTVSPRELFTVYLVNSGLALDEVSAKKVKTRTVDDRGAAMDNVVYKCISQNAPDVLERAAVKRTAKLKNDNAAAPAAPAAPVAPVAPVAPMSQFDWITLGREFLTSKPTNSQKMAVLVGLQELFKVKL
jgi:hypothetical protein